MIFPQLQSWLRQFDARFPLRLLLFAVIAPGAVWFGFLYHSADGARALLQRFGYFTMLATFVWWLLSLWRIARGEPTLRQSVSRSVFRRHRPAWLLIAGLTAMAWLTVPYSYKVLYDELVLQSTALNLHFFRELGTLVRGYEIDGVFQSLNTYLDKRPFFYPFLVSLVHDLTGYRILNGFVLNTVLMPLILGLVYVIARHLSGARAALVALACFGASPLLAQNANGTGMEMLNLVMLLATIGLAIFYLEKPEAPRLSALVLTCVLLAQTRYESSLYVVCVGLVILEGWRRTRRVILSPAGLCGPLLLVPCALHNTYLSGTPLLWELRDDVESRFGSQYVMDNLGHAIGYFFSISSQVLNVWWLAVVGVFATGCLIVSLWGSRHGWRTVKPAVLVLLVASTGVIANLGLLMFYFWGQLDDPIVARLSLPFYLMLAFAVAWMAGRCRVEWQPQVCAWLVAGALLSYVAFGMKATAYNGRINQLATEIAWEEEWVARRPPMPRLMITNKTGLNWMVSRISSITTGLVRTKAEKVKFHMDAGTFREVLVSQYYRPTGAGGGFVIDPRDELPTAFVLEPLTERQVGGKLLRISRVVEIRLPVSVAAGEKVETP